ncbi:MAG: hypothetical protein JST73_13015 [Actinobacteria bacterium]|nr:hypothetical protein [Actinomycetota bacterium]
MTDGVGDSDPSVVEAEARYRSIAQDLVDALDAAIVAWIERVAGARVPADVSDAQRAHASALISQAAAATHAEAMPRLHALVETDVARHSATPLGVLRDALGPPNRVLAELGVPAPHRDPVAAAMFPADTYDLGPVNFGDIDPELHDLGIAWGAAKAHVMLRRHHH